MGYLTIALVLLSVWAMAADGPGATITTTNSDGTSLNFEVGSARVVRKSQAAPAPAPAAQPRHAAGAPWRAGQPASPKRREKPAEKKAPEEAKEAAPRGPSADIYYYKDERGSLKAVEGLSAVPEKFRKKAKKARKY